MNIREFGINFYFILTIICTARCCIILIGKYSLNVATIYNNIGDVHHGRGMDNAALEVYENGEIYIFSNTS